MGSLLQEDSISDSDVEYEALGLEDIQKSRLVNNISKLTSENVHGVEDAELGETPSRYRQLLEKYASACHTERLTDSRVAGKESICDGLSQIGGETSLVSEKGEQTNQKNLIHRSLVLPHHRQGNTSDTNMMEATSSSISIAKSNNLEPNVGEDGEENEIADSQSENENSSLVIRHGEGISEKSFHEKANIKPQDNLKEGDKDQAALQLFLFHQGRYSSYHNLRRRTFKNIYPYIADQCVHLELVQLEDIESAYKERSIEEIVKALNKIYMSKKKEHPHNRLYKKRSFYQLLGDHTKHQIGAAESNDGLQEKERENHNDPNDDLNDIIEPFDNLSNSEETYEDLETGAEPESDPDYQNIGNQNHRVDQQDVEQLDEGYEAHIDQDIDPSESSVTGKALEEEFLAGGRLVKKRKMFKGVLPESSKRRKEFFQPIKTPVKKKKIITPRKGLAIKKKHQPKLAQPDNDYFINDNENYDDDEAVYLTRNFNETEGTTNFSTFDNDFLKNGSYYDEGDTEQLDQFSESELEMLKSDSADEIDVFRVDSYSSDVSESEKDTKTVAIPNLDPPIYVKSSSDSDYDDELVKITSSNSHILGSHKTKFNGDFGGNIDLFYGSAEEDNHFDSSVKGIYSTSSRSASERKRSAPSKRQYKGTRNNNLQSLTKKRITSTYPRSSSSYLTKNRIKKHNKPQAQKKLDGYKSIRASSASNIPRKGSNLFQKSTSSLSLHNNHGAISHTTRMVHSSSLGPNPFTKDRFRSKQLLYRDATSQTNSVSISNDKYVLHRSANAFTTQIEANSGKYKMISNHTGRVNPYVVEQTEGIEFTNEKGVIKPLKEFSYESNMLLHSINIDDILLIDEALIRLSFDSVNISFGSLQMSLTILNIEQGNKNMELCLEYLTKNLMSVEESKADEFYSILKGLIKWCIIAKEPPSHQTSKKLDDLVVTFQKTRCMRNNILIFFPYIMLLQHIFRCLYKLRYPQTEQNFIIKPSMQLYVESLLATYEERFYYTLIKNETYTHRYESVFIGFKLLQFHKDYISVFNQALETAKMTEPSSFLRMILTFTSISYKTQNWSSLAIFSKKILSGAPKFREDQEILIYQYFLESIFSLKRMFFWTLDENVITVVYSLLSARGFEKFSTEAHPLILKVNPGSTMFSSDSLNMRFIKLLVCYSKEAKISGRLVEKLLPLGYFRSQNIGVSLSAIVNRINIVLIMAMLTSRDFTSQMMRLLRLVPDSENYLFLERGLEAISSFINIRLSDGNPYPFKLIKEFGNSCMENYKKHDSDGSPFSSSQTKRDNSLKALKQIVVKIKSFIELSTQSVKARVEAFMIVYEVGMFQIEFGDISITKRELLEAVIAASSSLLNLFEFQTLDFDTASMVKQSLYEPVSNLLSKRLHYISKNVVFEGRALIISLVKLSIRCAAVLVRHNVKPWNFFIYQGIPYWGPHEQRKKYELLIYQQVLHYAGTSYLKDFPDKFLEVLFSNIVCYHTENLFKYISELYEKDRKSSCLDFKFRSIGSLTESTFLATRTEFVINLITNTMNSKTLSQHEKQKYLEILTKSLKEQKDFVDNSKIVDILFEKFVTVIAKYLNYSGTSYLKHSREFSDLRVSLGILRAESGSCDFANQLNMIESPSETLVFIEKELVSSFIQDHTDDFIVEFSNAIKEDLKNSSLSSEEVKHSRLIDLTCIISIHIQLVSSFPILWAVISCLLAVLGSIIKYQRNLSKANFRCVFVLLSHFSAFELDKRTYLFYQLICYERLFLILCDLLDILDGYEDAKYFVNSFSFFQDDKSRFLDHKIRGSHSPYSEDIKAILMRCNLDRYIKKDFTKEEMSQRNLAFTASYNWYMKRIDVYIESKDNHRERDTVVDSLSEGVMGFF